MGAAVAGCNGDNSSPDAGVDASDVVIDVIIDPKNCVAPGTMPNDEGIGGYCSPGGGQCDTVGPGGSPRICSGDVQGTPMHAWFCTYPCTSSSTCGAGASCLTTAMGSSCIPNVCDAVEEAGADSGPPPDASTDAPSDSSPTDAPTG